MTDGPLQGDYLTAATAAVRIDELVTEIRLKLAPLMRTGDGEAAIERILEQLEEVATDAHDEAGCLRRDAVDLAPASVADETRDFWS